MSRDNKKITHTSLEINHLTPEQLYKSVSPEYAEELKGYFKFCFMRNPLARLVSLYHFEKQSKNWRINNPEMAKLSETYSFRHWCYKRDVQRQREFIRYEKKNHMDWIGVCDETMDEQFKELVKKLGINAELPHINVSKHKPWREYYNPKLVRDMKVKYDKDVDLFEKRFGSVW